MTNGSKHIIEKFCLEFNTPSEGNGKQLDKRSVEVFQQKLLPEMEKVFDRFGGDRNIRLDNLSIEMNVADPIRFEDQFIRQFLEQLSQKLEKVQQNSEESSEMESDLFRYFLEYGYFPWWAKTESVMELENKIMGENQIPAVASILGNDPDKLKRLVFQFSDTFLQTLVKNQNLIEFIKDLQQILSTFYRSTEVRNQLWLFVFYGLFFKNKSFEEVKIDIFKSTIDYFLQSEKSVISSKKLVNKVLNELKIVDNAFLMKLQKAVQSIHLNIEKNLEKTISEKKTIKKTIKKSERKTELKPDQKEWYTINAGLVLLHPFFVLFFESLGLTEKNIFKDFHAKNQAALLLQYLATGKSQSFENELILNKILCDIPLSVPIEKDLILNEKIKAEAEQLLNAVIKHWSALKNTSPESLRNTFLQREGKLTKNENGSWNLFIQHATFDILISKLPWSISIIKLPWMKNMLQVEWA